MRQFISKKEPDKKGLLEITGKDFHYMRDVLRISTGDMILVSPEGSENIFMTAAKIDGAEKKIILQKCDTQEKGGSLETAAHDRAAVEYTLLQFIPKPAKMELIVRQATECGVARIIPVIGEYTQGGTEKSLQKNPERYEKIIREARQQSGSPVETKIALPVKLSDAIKECAGHSSAFVFYERSGRTLPPQKAFLELTQKGVQQKPLRIFLATGSEGGISPEEFEALLNAGFTGVHFNTNILRCETAALYAIAAVQAAVGE